MKFNRLAGIAAIVLGTIFSTSCGETFRPVATPIFSGGGDPQNFRQAIVISTNSTGVEGGVTHINVSGDTLSAQMQAGRGATHGVLSNGQVWTANSLENSTTHYFAFFAPTVGPSTTSLTSRPVFMFGNATTVFAALPTANKVSIINLSNSTEASTVDVGTTPVSITGTSDGTKIYVANQGSNNVTVVNSDGTIKATIGVGTAPSWITINQDSSRVYVVNRGSNNVSVIDTATETVIATVGVGAGPTFAIFDTVALRLYVANTGGNTVSVITGTSLAGTATVGANPTSVAPLKDGTRYYVSHSGTNTVSVVSALNHQQLRTVTVGNGAKSIAASPDNSKVYVANTASGTVSVIRTVDDTVVVTLTLPANMQPQFVFVTP